MKIFLRGFKKANDKQFWSTLMKLQKNNLAFRTAFQAYLEEDENTYQIRMRQEMKQKIIA